MSRSLPKHSEIDITKFIPKQNVNNQQLSTSLEQLERLAKMTLRNIFADKLYYLTTKLICRIHRHVWQIKHRLQ